MEQAAVGITSINNDYVVDDDDWATDIDDDEEPESRINFIWQEMRNVVVENL